MSCLIKNPLSRLFACSFASCEPILMFLDVLESLELPLFDFFGIEARATHPGGSSQHLKIGFPGFGNELDL